MTGKRLLFVWSDASWCPSNLTGVVAADDDYTMGVLSSRAHEAWAWSRSSTLETRLRYTPTTAFETFPWPDPTPAQKSAVATAGAAMVDRRMEIALAEGIGLTELYNRVDDGAHHDLLRLQRNLDEAVAAAYGWSKVVAQDDAQLVAALGRLNGRYAKSGGLALT